MAVETAVYVDTNLGHPTGGTLSKRWDVHRAKMGMVTVGATADNADTVAITLSNVGITTLWGVKCSRHDTINSILVNEEGTTAVASGVLTFTIGGATGNKARAIILVGV